MQEQQSWSQVLRQFMSDDFIGSLSFNQDCISQPAPLPPVHVKENLEKEKTTLTISFRLATFQELFAPKNSILQLK